MASAQSVWDPGTSKDERDHFVKLAERRRTKGKAMRSKKTKKVAAPKPRCRNEHCKQVLRKKDADHGGYCTRCYWEMRVAH